MNPLKSFGFFLVGIVATFTTIYSFYLIIDRFSRLPEKVQVGIVFSAGIVFLLWVFDGLFITAGQLVLRLF